MAVEAPPQSQARMDDLNKSVRSKSSEDGKKHGKLIAPALIEKSIDHMKEIKAKHAKEKVSLYSWIVISGGFFSNGYFFQADKHAAEELKKSATKDHTGEEKVGRLRFDQQLLFIHVQSRSLLQVEEERVPTDVEDPTVNAPVDVEPIDANKTTTGASGVINIEVSNHYPLTHGNKLSSDRYSPPLDFSEEALAKGSIDVSTMIKFTRVDIDDGEGEEEKNEQGLIKRQSIMSQKRGDEVEEPPTTNLKRLTTKIKRGMSKWTNAVDWNSPAVNVYLMLGLVLFFFAYLLAQGSFFDFLWQCGDNSNSDVRLGYFDVPWRWRVFHATRNFVNNNVMGGGDVGD